MPPQVAVASKNLAAGRTVVGLDVGVGEQVGLEIAALIEAARTDWALVGRLFHVKDFVDSQSSRLTKSFATFAAFEGLFLAVDVPGKQKKDIFSKLEVKTRVDCRF